MSIRAVSTAIVPLPIRMGFSLVAAFVAPMAALLPVRAHMMMPLLRGVMPCIRSRSDFPGI